MLWVSSFACMNYSYFFISNAHSAMPVKSVIEVNSNHLNTLSTIDLRVYAGNPKYNKGQPVNLIMMTAQPLEEIHQAIGWVKNMTFSGDSLSFFRYMGLILQREPPVSDLYFQGAPQNYAFQSVSNSNLIQREHIRWWHAGTTSDNRNIYLGAVSLDNEIEMKPYKGIVTLLHDIDPAVDNSRNHFATTIKEIFPNALLSSRSIGKEIASDNSEEDYWSDGTVTVIEL